MNIPDEAIDAAIEATTGHQHHDTVRVMLEAALPYLLADHRQRLVDASNNLRSMANKEASVDPYHHRLSGKTEGVDLALSYLDEILRTP